MKYSLKCGHRQDIVKFPHCIQIIYTLTLLWVTDVPFNAVLFKVYVASPQFLQKLHAPSELRFWNHVLDSHQLCLSELQTGTEDEVVEVSIRTAKKNNDG